jgi:hypothetical protein
VLKSILDLLAKVEDSCALFEVDHKDLSRLESVVAEELRPAFVEAENIELQSRQPAKSTKAPIQTKACKMVKRKPLKIDKVLIGKTIFGLFEHQCIIFRNQLKGLLVKRQFQASIWSPVSKMHLRRRTSLCL